MGNARVGERLVVPGGLRGLTDYVTSGQRLEESEGVSPAAKNH